MHWFLGLIAAWFVVLVLVWLFGPNGQWMTWASRAVGGAILLAFLWRFVIRAGPDD